MKKTPTCAGHWQRHAGWDDFICQSVYMAIMRSVHRHLSLVLACSTWSSETHPSRPLPLAPIALIWSRSIRIIPLLINHRDSRGATSHLSTGTPRFPSSLPPFHHEPPSFALSLAPPPFGIRAQLLISAGEHQLRSCPPPPRVCFFSLLIGTSITAQQQAAADLW